MSTRVPIPQLSANITEATVTAWMATVGETVAQGQALAEVTTDKAAFELEAPADGTLLTIYAREKSIVPVGYTVALIGAPGDTDPAVEADNRALLARQQSTIPKAEHARRRDGGDRVRATPKARKIARQHGLDLARIKADTGADLINETILAPYLESAS